MSTTTLYTNGRILTMVDPEDRPEAVLVRDGRIAFVGPLDQARAEAGVADIDEVPDAPVAEVDLAGRTLMPAFIDPHGHLYTHGVLAAMVDLEHAESIEEMIEAFRERAAQEEDSSSPLIGVKYDLDVLAEGRHPTRQELDQAASDRPVMAFHRSLHVGAVNSFLLREAGVDADTPDPEGGRYGREADGRTPDGYVEEHPAMAPLMPVLSPQNPDSLLPTSDIAPAEVIALAAKDYLAHGITTAQDGASDEATVARLVQAANEGAIPIDLVCYPVVAGSVPNAFEDHPDFVGDYRGRLRLGGYKMLLDGAPQARSAWLSRPYEKLEGSDSESNDGEEPTSGYPIMTDEQVEGAARAAAANGRQLIVHCNGDAASEQWISAVERIAKEDPAILEQRPVMIHAQTVRADQLERMERINMIASIFVGHTWFWGDVHLKNLGPERGAAISPGRTALDKGVRITLHQDTPVTPPDMIHSIWAAVNRISRHGTEIGPAERITPWEALRAVTHDAAYQYGEEAEKGLLREGMRADLVILSEDPLAIDPAKLRDVQVVATIKDGEELYHREENG